VQGQGTFEATLRGVECAWSYSMLRVSFGVVSNDKQAWTMCVACDGHRSSSSFSLAESTGRARCVTRVSVSREGIALGQYPASAGDAKR